MGPDDDLRLQKRYQIMKAGGMSAILHAITPFGTCFVLDFSGSRHENLPIYCKRLTWFTHAYGKIG